MTATDAKTKKRRSRFVPTPNFTPLTPTQADRALFRALDRHGFLPTPYLYEFAKTHRSYYHDHQERLTKLHHGYCGHPDHHTQNRDGHACKPVRYVACDQRQHANINARYQPLVYNLLPTALPYIEPARFFKRSSSFVHDLFLGCLTASFELQAHRFIFRDEILDHRKAGAYVCPEATRTAKTPFVFDELAPDDLFGIEYEDGGFRFFALEVDRATERIETERPLDAGSSIARKIAANIRILETNEHKRRFGLPTITFAYATTSEGHAQKILDYVAKAVPEKWHSKFVVKSFYEFDEEKQRASISFGVDWRVPKLLLDALPGWRSPLGMIDLGTKKALA